MCPLGHAAWETFRALLDGRMITDRATKLPDDVAPLDLVRAVGCTGISQHSITDPAIDLAERAAREAMAEAGAEPDELATFIGASKGAVYAMAGAAKDGCETVPPDARLAIATGPHGYVAHHLCRRLKLQGAHNVVAACASSLTALHCARLALQRPGGPGKALVITAEASLLPLFVHSYQRLRVLSKLSRDEYLGRPLDKNRNGFVLAEQAAAVVIERVQARRAGQFELVDTAIACESKDIVRNSSDMPALRRVADRILTRMKVDVIHPHATGTIEHDPAELAAYEHPDSAIYACKGALGHGLGAAGLVALVIARLCARTKRTPPMPWITDPISPEIIAGGQSLNKEDATTHAVFAAGFGGHVAGALARG